MIFRGFRIPVVLAMLVLTLAVLLAGTYLYRRETEVAPPIRRAAAIQGVTELAIRRNGGLVGVAPIEALRNTYREIEAMAEEVLPRGRLRLGLGDRRIPGLAGAYHRVHPTVYEAAARGTCSQLGQVKAALSEEGWRARLSVDDRFIHVQIQDRDGEYLYELVPLTRGGGGEEPT